MSTNKDFASAGQTNQGIVDGRPEGQQPKPSPVTLDTVTDKDASLESAGENMDVTASSTLGGATSGDVHESIGKPASGMTSKEIHHDGQGHRKRDRAGADQFGDKAM